jgi:hypothetical protein
MMRRIQPEGRQDWPLITDPVVGLLVTFSDMLILAEVVHAFEEESERVRIATSGPGAAKPDDWGGMMVALIYHIHGGLLPVSWTRRQDRDHGTEEWA